MKNYRVRNLREMHLQSLGGQWVQGMHGMTVVADDLVIACMGTAPMPWGDELWIRVTKEVLSWGDRLRIARLGRWFVGELLSTREALFAHAPPGYEHERLFRWAGLEPECEFLSLDLKVYCRWVARVPCLSR